MAITIEDSGIGTANNGNDVTLTITGAQQDDYVLLIGGHSDNASPGTAGPVTSGYFTIFQTDSTDHSKGAWYKKMGASPDASVVGAGDGVTQHATVYGFYLLRGVDGTTFNDAAPVEDSAPTDYDPPSITTVTDGALVVAIAFDGDAVINITAAPPGYTNRKQATRLDTIRMTCGFASAIKATAGAEDPGLFGDDGTPVNEYTATLAVRPEVAAAPESAPDVSPIVVGSGWI